VARKWSNENLPGALHYVTGVTGNGQQIFNRTDGCLDVLDVCRQLRQDWPFKLVAYVLMPDHLHMIVNPRDGAISELIASLEGLSSSRILAAEPGVPSTVNQTEISDPLPQVWQKPFKATPLYSGWMIWRKINYIHSRAVRVGLVQSASDYRWSSYRSFYSRADDPLAVDRDWWWPEAGRIADAG